jgi:hypothetical protein
MGPVVKREISQKILRILTVMSPGDLGGESADSETAERYCREAEERWTARAPSVVRRFRDDEATGKLEILVPKPCPNGCLPPQN